MVYAETSTGNYFQHESSVSGTSDEIVAGCLWIMNLRTMICLLPMKTLVLLDEFLCLEEAPKIKNLPRS